MKLEPYEREFAQLQGLPSQRSSRALLHFPRNLAPDFPHYISGKEFEKMKTFIVYDLDSKMPVAVGEQVSAETARYCASAATGIFHANLLAEEIDLENNLPAEPQYGSFL